METGCLSLYEDSKQFLQDGFNSKTNYNIILKHLNNYTRQLIASYSLNIVEKSPRQSYFTLSN